jgi:hypothetical protein
MKFVLFRDQSPVCPFCNSGRIYKSRRKGLLELLLRRIFFISPYRCLACDARHFRFRLPERRRPDQPLPTAPK